MVWWKFGPSVNLLANHNTVWKSKFQSYPVLGWKIPKSSKFHMYLCSTVQQNAKRKPNGFNLKICFKGAFKSYVCIFWHFLTTYVPSLYFLCSKLQVFLTTYPPLSANVICESSLRKYSIFFRCQHKITGGQITGPMQAFPCLQILVCSNAKGKLALLWTVIPQTSCSNALSMFSNG